jgi:hypothetical protein
MNKEQGFYHPQKGYWQGAELTDEYTLPEGAVLVPLIPGPDTTWSWNGTEWVEVPPDPAEQLAAERAAMVASPAQIKVTLQMLCLLDTVTAIAEADPVAKIIWNEALEIRRTNPLIDALRADFTPEQIDDIFRYAQALVI